MYHLFRKKDAGDLFLRKVGSKLFYYLLTHCCRVYFFYYCKVFIKTLLPSLMGLISALIRVFNYNLFFKVFFH